MANATYSQNLQLGGVSIDKAITRTADSQKSYEVSLPAGKSGTLTTRTDDNTGVATVSSGHGVTTSDKVDVYWTGGMRYGMTVTATDATTISVDLGAGDNFPVQDTAIVVTPQVTVNTNVDGDNAQIIGISLEYTAAVSSAGHVDMQDSGSATIAELDLTGNAPLVYDLAAGITNPFTGNPITSTLASNGDGTNAATLKILSLEDSTP